MIIGTDHLNIALKSRQRGIPQGRDGYRTLKREKKSKSTRKNDLGTLWHTACLSSWLPTLALSRLTNRAPFPP